MSGYNEDYYPIPKLLAAIVDRSDSIYLEEVLEEKHVPFHFMFHAMGTASSETLRTFGLSGTEKTVCFCLTPGFQSQPLMTAITERMQFTKPGKGIVFILPISGVSTTIMGAFTKEFEKNRERWINHMEQKAEKVNREAIFELVVAIVDQGFSEKVMAVAHDSGIRGGTIINARRTGIDEAVKFFGISLQSEKEIVAILIPNTQKKALMQSISKSCGMKTEAHGIVISLPVESCAGIDWKTVNDDPDIK